MTTTTALRAVSSAVASAAATDQTSRQSNFAVGLKNLSRRARRAKRATPSGHSKVVVATVAPIENGDKPFAAWDLPPTIPLRTDIKTIMIIGAGPIVIGQVRDNGGCCSGASAPSRCFGFDFSF